MSDSKESIFRHPLATMVVGFLLTGVVGTLLTNHFAESRQAEAKALEQRDARRKAVLELSRLSSERVTRAELLGVALERHASVEVICELKKLYDEAEANWLLNRQAALLLAREVLGADDYDSFRKEVETRVGKRRMLPLRDCLDQACTQAMSGGDGAATWKSCRGAELLKDCRPCNEAVLDLFYDLASMSHLQDTDPRAVRTRDQARQRLEAACP